MFSQEPRRFLKKNQLMEVICQFRFPEILAIAAKPPVDFQEAIRDEFPQYSARKEIPAPKIAGTPGNFSLQNQPETINYQFAAADGSWRVNLTSKFISLASSRYTSWEDFAKKLDRPLAAFIQIYKPAYYERVGLRYINAFSRKDLDLEGVPFRELVPALLSGHPGGGGCERSVHQPLLHGCGDCPAGWLPGQDSRRSRHGEAGRTGGQGGSLHSGQRSVHVRQCTHQPVRPEPCRPSISRLAACSWAPSPSGSMTLWSLWSFCKL